MVGVMGGTKAGFPEEGPRRVQGDGREFTEKQNGWRVRTLKGGMKQNGMVGCSIIIRAFSNCQKKKQKKAKWLSEEALKIAEKRRDAKGKGEKERYPFECRASKNIKER